MDNSLLLLLILVVILGFVMWNMQGGETFQALFPRSEKYSEEFGGDPGTPRYSDGHYTLTWTPVSGIDDYSIKISDSSGLVFGPQTVSGVCDSEKCSYSFQNGDWSTAYNSCVASVNSVGTLSTYTCKDGTSGAGPFPALVSMEAAGSTDKSTVSTDLFIAGKTIVTNPGKAVGSNEIYGAMVVTWSGVSGDELDRLRGGDTTITISGGIWNEGLSVESDPPSYYLRQYGDISQMSFSSVGGTTDNPGFIVGYYAGDPATDAPVKVTLAAGQQVQISVTFENKFGTKSSVSAVQIVKDVKPDPPSNLNFSWVS